MPHPRNVARHYIGWPAYSSELRESVSVTGITGWPGFPFFGPPLTAGGWDDGVRRGYSCACDSFVVHYIIIRVLLDWGDGRS